MVENPRTAGGTGGLRLLNQPKPAAVEANAHGEPDAVVVQGRFQRVRAIQDSWRIDDEWWREEIARRYFAVELENGRKLTVYHDLVGGGWFAQAYDGPQPAKGTPNKRRD
ncbi:hypothetical protein [Candidatus Amarobacter glycogenicus]|jgi:hypothetical protein|uniref:hypothetical protein n=1 Tax=Candidatus Amarobacter glycogenicus TaxID=3140699 RepID=UPI0031CC50C3